MESKRQEIQTFLNANKQVFAEKIVDKQYEAQPELWNRYGNEGRLLSIRDAGYHLPFLAEAVIANDPTIFKEYVSWVKILFHGIKIPESILVKTLECTREVLEQEMPSDLFELVNPTLLSGIDYLAQAPSEIDSYLDDSTELGRLAIEYNRALLSGNRNLASSLILDAVKNGIKIEDIYLEVFQKSQYEVGRLWLSNQISVAKEHFCSAATQMIMSQLYPYIFSTTRIGKKFIGASVGGELHEIGIRMVADFFEMKGWDTFYLGANVPASAILKTIEENNVDLVGLSIALTYHSSLLSDTISEIRRSQVGRDVKILIGGVALNSRSDLARFGADGFAPNAPNAIELAEKLIN